MRLALRFVVGAALGAALPSCHDPYIHSDLEPQPPPWAAPDLRDDCRVFDVKCGREIALDSMIGALASADVVFLGETHDDESTHRMELLLFEGIVDDAGGGSLAMEMFERDVNPVLERYLRGEIGEREFLDAARPWGNYGTDYRPLVEAAKTRHLRVVGSNAPRPLTRKIAQGGKAALDALSPEERSQIAAQLLPNSPDYWKRVDNATRGHMTSGVASASAPSDEDRLYSVQSLWDNTMGETASHAPIFGTPLVHVNGGFHSRFFAGTMSQARRRMPDDAKIRSVDIVPVDDLAAARPERDPPVADYQVFVKNRAKSADDGRFTVATTRGQDYWLKLPAAARNHGEAKTPLLVWLGLEGSDPQDSLAWLDAMISNEAAVMVLRSTYPQVQDDETEGARWFLDSSFAGDLDAVARSVQEATGYVVRNYAIDGKRVVVAGAGGGATAAAYCAIWGGDATTSAVAIAPEKSERFRDFPLRVPETAKLGAEMLKNRSVAVLARPDSIAFWQEEAGQQTETPVAIAVDEVPADRWLQPRRVEHAIRTALGLAPKPADAAKRVHVVLPAESARARTWALRLLFASSEGDGAQLAILTPAELAAMDPAAVQSTALDLSVRAADFAKPHALPAASGGFGGTTIVVLPAETSAEEQAAWIALEAEDKDPLRAASRFSRLRVATADGERALPSVLEKLKAENRKNVLIVPAEFCATAERLAALHAAASPFESTMTLHFLAGLGGTMRRGA